MATSRDDRSTLDQTLSNILGFEDGVSGIVEHLLAIETNEVRPLSFSTPARSSTVDGWCGEHDAVVSSRLVSPPI
jgi:hypothetical protein